MSIFENANGESSRVLNYFGFSVLAIGVVTLIWSVNHHSTPKNNNQTNGVASTKDNTPKPVVNNFYDCWENLKKAPTDTSVCTANGRDYNRPTSFSEDSVRGLNKVPASAKPVVLSQAKTRFDACTTSNPKAVPTTGIVGANDRLVYQSSNCVSSQKSLLVNQDGWKEVALPGNVLSCSITDQYRVPKAIVADGKSKTPGTANCIDASGHPRALKD